MSGCIICVNLFIVQTCLINSQYSLLPFLLLQEKHDAIRNPILGISEDVDFTGIDCSEKRECCEVIYSNFLAGQNVDRSSKNYLMITHLIDFV